MMRAFSGVLCVLAATAAWGAQAPSLMGPAKLDGYLVLPFENQSSVKVLDWQSSALAVTLADKLESHPLLRPAYGPAIFDRIDPSTSFNAEEVARAANAAAAKWVFAGLFARPNWKSELTLRLYKVVVFGEKVTLDLVAETRSVEPREAIQTQLDNNLLTLLERAGWTFDSSVMGALSRHPTKDLYAYTLFGRALNAELGIGEERNVGTALKLFKRVILVDPKFAEAHRFYAMVLLAFGERSRATAELARALDLRPGYHAALQGLAQIYRETNHARAMEAAEHILELRPDDVETRTLVAELALETGDLDRALLEAQKVVAAEPSHLGAHHTLALAYASQGATTDLARELEQIEELAPTDVEVKLDLASSYQRLGKYDKAIAAYEDVIKRQPRHTGALKLLGDCYRRQGQLDRSIVIYQRLLHASPEDPRPYFLLGAVYEQSGNDRKAVELFQEAQQFPRYVGEAWTNLGSLALRHGDLTKAIWYLSRAVARAPTRPKGHYNYALALSEKKERQRALDELKIAGDLDPSDAEIRYTEGVILLRLGRLDEARQKFLEALKRRPEHADAKHNLALLDELERRYGGEHAGAGAR